MDDDRMLENNPESIEIYTEPVGLMKMSRWSRPSDINQQSLKWNAIESKSIKYDDIPEDILEESIPMMFWLDSIMEDSSLSDYLSESENMESMWIISMGNEEELIDLFFDLCWKYNWFIKILENRDRSCILEDKNCDESDYQKNKCFELINVTN
jgi:hypothetical protein